MKKISPARKLFRISLFFILSLGLVYFASLHISKEQTLTKEDVLLKKLLHKKDSSQAPLQEKTQKLKTTQDTPLVLKKGIFNPEAQDSDSLHRGRGGISLVRFMGKNQLVFRDDFSVTNGPDYKIYLLSEQGVETEERFLELKESSHRLSSLKQFKGYQVFKIPDNVDVNDLKSVLIWCEAFSQFISYADLN